MEVEDSLYENEELFRRFFERKAESDWARFKKYSVIEKDIQPHMEMQYSEEDKDYLICANYKLSDFDKSVINTYFMDNGLSKYDDFKGTAAKIRNIIGEYLSGQSKRKLDESTEIDEKDLMIGKYFSAEIITQIFFGYIDKQVECPIRSRQGMSMEQYLFEVDFRKLIDDIFIQKGLMTLYQVLSKRIAILYMQDRNLKISTSHASYLARANYELLIQGYESIMETTFGLHKKELDITLPIPLFMENSKDGVYFEDEFVDGKTALINGNELVKSLDIFKRI